MHFVEQFCISWMFFEDLILLTGFFLYIYSIIFTMGLQNKKILASILFVSISFVCVAQGGQPPPPTPPPPPGLPIDDALPVLFVFALIFGIYRKFRLIKR